jgi:tRNA A37 threonylcarbamoyladenosine synthetase subunit TsaC/SUA5/YrdC
MAILRCDATGLTVAVDTLACGGAVVLPTPSPLPYAVAAHSPTAVNIAKRRPAEQPVAVWLVDGLRALRPHLALDAGLIDLAAWLLVEELVTVLVPLAAPHRAPNWLRPAVLDGYVLVAGPRLAPLAALHDALAPLYVSSGNITGRPPATTAADADLAFLGQLVVIDGDEYRDPSRRHGSSSMLRFDEHCGIELVRPGVQDAHGDPDRYLGEVLRRGAAALGGLTH